MSRWNAKVTRQDPQSMSGQPLGQPPGQRLIQDRGRRQGGPGAGPAKDLKDALEKAQNLMKADRFNDALEVYEAILEKHPETALAYVGIGNIHARRGEYDDALEYYAGALHVRKDFPPALMMSGNVYVKQGLLDKALKIYQELLEINPNLGNARLSMSRIYARMGKFEEALDCLNEALRHNPQLEKARLARARVYQNMGDINTALKELTDAVTRAPDSPQAQIQYANLLIERGEFNLAASACEKAIAIKPDSALIHSLLGRAYLGAGQHELALHAYTKATEIDPNLHIASVGIAKANMELGNLAGAKKVLVTMSNKMWNLALVHRLLGDILMREGAYPDAIAEFQAAILHGKRVVEAYPDLLAVQPVAGDDRMTAEAYQRAFAQVDFESLIDREGDGAAYADDENRL